MSQLLGMDVAEVRALAVFMKTNGTNLMGIRDRLTTSVGVSTWKGSDADEFTRQWNGVLRQQLTEVANALLAAQELLVRNADHQQATSDTLDGGSGGGQGGFPGSGPNGVFDRIGQAWGQGMETLKDGAAWVGDRIDDGLDWVGDRIQDGRDLADRVWDDLTDRAAAGWAGLQRLGGDTANFLMLPFTTLMDKGRLPYPMEVLASGALVLASGAGTVANVVTGEDQHFFDDGKPDVGDAHVREREDATVPTDFLSFTRNTMDVYGSEDTDGEVRVTVIRNPGEPPRYLVAIPGTEGPEISTLPAWGGSAAANDWHANVRLMANGTSTYNQGVMEAIDKAIALDRAAHPGESGPPSILLTGHSQGGFNAAYIAANEEFAARYDIQGVVNYAGPIDNADVPSHIPVLSLVNGDLGQGDLIPTLDGGRLHVLNPLADKLNVPRPGPILDALSPSHIEQVRMPAHAGWGDGPMESITLNHEQAGYINNVEDMVSPNATGTVADNFDRIQQWEQEHGLDRFYMQDGGQFTEIQVNVGRAVE